MKNQLESSLVGRWVKGRNTYRNKDYVWPEDRGGLFPSFDYSKKQLKELTKHQMTRLYYEDIEGEVVAVSTEGQGQYQSLRLWILIDGKARYLEEGATIMPAGWVPEIPR